MLAQTLNRGEIEVWRDVCRRAKSDVRLRQRIARIVLTVPTPLPRFWLAALASLGESVDLGAPVPDYTTHVGLTRPAIPALHPHSAASLWSASSTGSASTPESNRCARSPRNASQSASGRRRPTRPASERSPLVSAGVTCRAALISIATTSRARSTTRSTSAPASVRYVDSFHPLRRA